MASLKDKYYKRLHRARLTMVELSDPQNHTDILQRNYPNHGFTESAEKQANSH